MENLIPDLVTKVDAVTSSFVQNAYQAFWASSGSAIRYAMALYVIIFGIMVLQNYIELTISEAVRHILYLTSVYALLSNWSVFSLFLADIFTKGPSYLIQILSASAFGASFDEKKILGVIFQKGFDCYFALCARASLTSIGFLLTGVAILVMTLLTVGEALILIIGAKIALTVLLALAPLFIVLLLFRSTRDFFSQYLRQLFNFALIAPITVAVLALVIKFVEDAITRFQLSLTTETSGFGGVEFMYSMICFFILYRLLGQVQALASGLGGGLQLSVGHSLTTGFQNALSYGAVGGLMMWNAGLKARSEYRKLKARKLEAKAKPSPYLARKSKSGTGS